VREAIVHGKRTTQKGRLPAGDLYHDKLTGSGDLRELGESQTHSQIARAHFRVVQDLHFFLKYLLHMDANRKPEDKERKKQITKARNT
jgi:hypothetical protein